MELIGRLAEIAILNDAVTTQKPELIAIYGRRRIGKTFLVRHVFSKHLCFEMSGSYNTNTPAQLLNFSAVLAKCRKPAKPLPVPANWQEAFLQLATYLERIRSPRKKVIFFDELPWLDSMHSGFLGAFDYFWNSWATRRTDVVVVICGSAASWMINKIVYNKGGLHNRLTRQLRLLPFTLAETKAFLQAKSIRLDDYQVAELYMITGGVPHYLDAVQPGKSTTQNIDALCFADNGLLKNEFDKLFQSLYDDATIHKAIIRALAGKRSGLTRNEIIAAAKLTSGGYVSNILAELEESGFLAAYTPLSKKTKDTVYRLTDEYSLFYIKFIEKNKLQAKGAWAALSAGNSWKSWSGYAFENLCLKHVQAIKKALGIENISTEQSAWYSKKEGAQIDLVIERADRCTNLCEMKFTTGNYTITAAYAKELAHKAIAYRSATKTNKTIFTTLVTTFGLQPNEYAVQRIDNTVLLKDLF